MVESNGRAGALPYLPALDGLRGVAILSVVAVHLGWTIGGNGVTVFFALSGFLITSLLQHELETTGRIRYGRFFARRALRLLPALVVFLLLNMVLILVLADGWNRKAQLTLSALTPLYLNNWLIGLRIVPDTPLSHTWSLAVEEQFYLLAPFALVFLNRLVRSRRQLGFVLVCLALAASAWRIGVSSYFSEYRIYNGTDTRADAILYGAAAAIVWRAGGLRWLAKFGPVLLALLVAHLFLGVGAEPRSRSLACLGGYALVAIASSMLLVLLANGWPVARVLAVRPMVYVGKLSYGWYLWHYPLFAAVDGVGTEFGESGKIVLKLGLSLGAAVLSYELVDRPCAKLKRYLEPRENSVVNLQDTLPIGEQLTDTIAQPITHEAEFVGPTELGDCPRATSSSQTSA